MATYKHYSDEDRATALAVYEANGRNLSRTERELGIPRSTLRRWVKEPARAAPAELRHEKVADLGNVLEGLVYRMLDIADVTLTELDGKPLQVGEMTRMMTAVGILIDKMRLLREQSTARITIDDLRKAVEAEGFEWGDVIAEAEAIVDACDR